MCAKIGAVLLSSEITPWRQRRWRMIFVIFILGHFLLILRFLGFVPVSFHPNLSFIISLTYFHILIADLDTNEGLFLLAIPRKNDGNLTDLWIRCVPIAS